MPDLRPKPQRLLVTELWGLGDVALAVPFLQLARHHAQVTLLAKPHARILLERLCPEVELLPFHAPWTAHHGKYRLASWPWAELARLVAALRRRGFTAGVSARPDPRDHALLASARVALRAGFPRAGSRVLLTDPLALAGPHRHQHWQAIATYLGFGPLPAPTCAARAPRRIVIHTGAAQPTRTWPRERFIEIASRLRDQGYEVAMLDAGTGDQKDLIECLRGADRFVGNDSGPGHIAALLGIPTFTIFGAQKSGNFHPIHPQASWLDGAHCAYKPCNDYCRFAVPHCITGVSVAEVWRHLVAWLGQSPSR